MGGPAATLQMHKVEAFGDFVSVEKKAEGGTHHVRRSVDFMDLGGRQPLNRRERALNLWASTILWNISSQCKCNHVQQPT